jgi:hypothetical protein
MELAEVESTSFTDEARVSQTRGDTKSFDNLYASGNFRRVPEKTPLQTNLTHVLNEQRQLNILERAVNSLDLISEVEIKRDEMQERISLLVDIKQKLSEIDSFEERTLKPIAQILYPHIEPLHFVPHRDDLEKEADKQLEGLYSDHNKAVRQIAHERQNFARFFDDLKATGLDRITADVNIRLWYREKKSSFDQLLKDVKSQIIDTLGLTPHDSQIISLLARSLLT